MKFAVFASGYGTNLQHIIEAVKKGEITAELALVFSDNRKAYALQRAEAARIETLCLLRKDYASKQSYDRDIIIHLKERKIDFVILAGYMRMLTSYFVKQFPNTIMNVHPALLPSFKGTKGIKDTFTYGCKVAGATIHFLDEKLDHGPIILQESVKVQENETLETLTEKVHKIEYRIYKKAIQLFVEGRLKVKGRKIKILNKK